MTDREKIAAAIANARGNRRGVPDIVNILDILPEKLVDEVLDDADAVLAALGLGEGGENVIVPWEPTEAMLDAARDWSAAKYGRPVGNDGADGCYRAMLSARLGAKHDP